MAFSARQTPTNGIQVFNALTGSLHFHISTASRRVSSFFVNGNTLTIVFDNNIIEIWDLTKRQKIR